MARQYIRIKHKKSREILAEGPRGWGITPFEGNYYISGKYLKTDGFTHTAIPGFCPYKFFYIWMDFTINGELREASLGWKYVLPNPLFPFIWFRVGVPAHHPALSIEEYERDE